MPFPPNADSQSLYLAMAVAASAMLALGLLIMKGRAHALPIAEGAGIPRALLAWVADPAWLGGLALQTAGYALYVLAQAVLPVAIISVMMQGGIGLFVLFAVVVLGERASAAEWAGIAGTILGMVLMGLSLRAGEAQSPTNTGVMLVVSIAVLAGGLAPYMMPHFHQNGTAAAVFSGMMFGLASLYAKAMTNYYLLAPAMALLPRIVTNPYVYGVILTNIAGMAALQNSFASARGLIAMPLSTALSNLTPIAGAMIVFGERLPASHSAALMRIGAFGLTIAGGALLANPGGEDQEAERLPAAQGQ